MRITITKNHIKRGKRYRSEYCPIALGLKERFKKEDVRVQQYNAEIGIYYIPLSQRACKFIEDFDNKKKVKPFSFNLDY